MQKIISNFSLLLLIAFASGACNKAALPATACSETQVLSEFTDPDGNALVIYEDGTAYSRNNGKCEFILQYFDPNFAQDNYVESEGRWYLLLENNARFPTKNNFIEDFESYTNLNALFPKTEQDTQLYWVTFVLQSPSAKTVSEYVALRKCILDGSCDFIDNRLRLSPDPVDPDNQVMEFSGVAPTEDMVVSKTSLKSSLSHFTKGEEVWFQADYYFAQGLPFSIVDLENEYFDGGPGPRIVIDRIQLAVENKFGAKKRYRQPTEQAIEVPEKQWVQIKLHLIYDDQGEGLIELWQDGKQLLSQRGITLPSSNSIQNALEIGATAHQEDCKVYLDNIRISDQPF